MGRILVALYKDTQTARAVVDSLLEAGFSAGDIKLLASDTDSAHGNSGEISASECAGLGALIGALVGISTSLLPGIGPAVGVGVVGAALTAGVGAAVGALTGGITAGLIDFAPAEPEMRHHAGTIVCLTTQVHWLEWAEKIMLRYQPIRIEERTTDSYSSPWLSLIVSKQDSGKLPTLAEISATKLRQIDPNIKLHNSVRIYEYPN